VMSRNKHKTEDNPQTENEVDNISNPDSIPVRIFDCILNTVYNTGVSVETIKSITNTYGGIGRQIKRDGEDRYLLVKTGDNTYKPVSGGIGDANSSAKLYEQMQLPEMEIVMDMREDKSFAQKYGKVIWWLAVIGFLIFLVTSAHKK
jgi:hypothetical protein